MGVIEGTLIGSFAIGELRLSVSLRQPLGAWETPSAKMVFLGPLFVSCYLNSSNLLTNLRPLGESQAVVRGHDASISSRSQGAFSRTSQQFRGVMKIRRSEIANFPSCEFLKF